MKGSSSHFCLLIEKPENCPQESFDALHEVFVGDVCDGQFPIFGGEQSLPPAYLSVPQHVDNFDGYDIYGHRAPYGPIYGPQYSFQPKLNSRPILSLK